MHHPRAKHLHPTAVFTGAAALAITDGTIHVHLGTGFGEGEVTPTEAYPPILAEQFASSPLEAALEICHRAVLIDQQTFDLVEHGLVRGIDGLVAVDLARNDDAYRWPHLLHH